LIAAVKYPFKENI